VGPRVSTMGWIGFGEETVTRVRLCVILNVKHILVDDIIFACASKRRRKFENKKERERYRER